MPNPFTKALIEGLLVLLLVVPAVAQEPAPHHHPNPVSSSGTPEHHHDHKADSPQSDDGHAPNLASSYLLSLSSGTSLNPAAWSMPMLMNRLGDWNLMWMGQAFLVSTQQTGPRGGDKVYSANWGMLAATRNLGRGSLMLRGMVSLDPITVSGKRYPLLFQTGETAYGKPLVDGQHPHDLLMEIGVHYARPLGSKALVNFYYAPVGDAALGPVAFPHRASAMDLPQSALGHHWQDATHIANNVFTAGLSFRKFRFEASTFRGREPNENRWNIDMGAMDSWSGRITYQPSRNWLAQFSTGRIRRPESHHLDDVVRSTASVHHTRLMSNGGEWSTSLIWARNYKTIGRYATQAILAETVLPVSRRNLLTSRFEWSQRDELFEYDHDLAHEIFVKTGKRAFNVSAYTVGYTRELGSLRSVQTAVGFNVTAYTFASALNPYYGQRPMGFNVFLRFRLKGRG